VKRNWIILGCSAALLAIGGFAFTAAYTPAEFGCAITVARFEVANAKEQHEIEIRPADRADRVHLTLREKYHGLVYDGPALAFADVPCDASKGWGDPVLALDGIVRFEHGLSIIGLLPVDQGRSAGDRPLTPLEAPPDRPIGIDPSARWFGSPSGHDVYVLGNADMANGTVYPLTVFSDFRRLDAISGAYSFHTPAQTETGDFITIENALSPDNAAANAEITGYIYPLAFTTTNGLVVPVSPLKSMCANDRRIKVDRVSLWYGLEVSIANCARTGP
jgi:hypothetical protein